MSRSKKANDYLAGAVAGFLVGMYVGVAFVSIILTIRGDA